MILATPQGNVERRMFEASALIPPPGSRMSVSSSVMRAREIAIPAVACAVQLVSETMGIPVMRVYTGDAEERRPDRTAQQNELFQDPCECDTSFDLWCDTAASIELEQGAFLWKTKTSAGVEELHPVDPRAFVVTRPAMNQPRVIRARIEGEMRDVTSKVIFIRGWSPVAGAATGMSKLEMHRQPLRTATALEEYRGSYLENDGMPGLVLDASGKQPDRIQRQELLESWDNRHRGPENKGKVGMIWGDVKAITQLAPTLQEAQAAELQELVVLEVARMWRIYPPDLLHAAMDRRPPPTTAEIWSDLFLRFTMLHRMRRIERAISADRDVFPDRSRYGRFDVDELLRGDIKTLAMMIHQLVQVGVLNRNEGRAYLGKPPVPGGDKFQETPVGGAPNAPPAAAGANDDEPVPTG